MLESRDLHALIAPFAVITTSLVLWYGGACMLSWWLARLRRKTASAPPLEQAGVSIYCAACSQVPRLNHERCQACNAINIRPWHIELHQLLSSLAAYHDGQACLATTEADRADLIRLHSKAGELLSAMGSRRHVDERIQRLRMLNWTAWCNAAMAAGPTPGVLGDEPHKRRRVHSEVLTSERLEGRPLATPPVPYAWRSASGQEP